MKTTYYGAELINTWERLTLSGKTSYEFQDAEYPRTKTQEKDNIIFKIDCNYYLFIEKSKLNIYNQNYQLLKSIELPKPIPSKHTLPISELLNSINSTNSSNSTYFYQLSVYDKKGNEDRTGVGSFKVE